MYRFPNRTGEIGVYVSGTPDSVTLSGTALASLRTFAAAAASGKLATGETVGIAVRAVSDTSRWAVWQAVYDSGGALVASVVEDVSTSTLTDGASVEVIACLTDGILTALLPEADAAMWNGPDDWDISSSGTAWDAENSWYGHDSLTNNKLILTPTAAGANAGWQTGLRPTDLSVELYLPPEYSIDTEYAMLRVYYDSAPYDPADPPNYVEGDYVGSGQPDDHWVTLACPNLATDLAADIVAIGIVNLAGGMTIEGAAYRLRNIVFQTT